MVRVGFFYIFFYLSSRSPRFFALTKDRKLRSLLLTPPAFLTDACGVNVGMYIVAAAHSYIY